MTSSERIVGRATEIFVYRFTERVGRSWRRELVCNVTVGSDLTEVARHLPLGRYRAEWRDARRWVVHVQTWIFDQRGFRALPPKANRKKPRTVPPPEHVPGASRSSRRDMGVRSTVRGGVPRANSTR